MTGLPPGLRERRPLDELDVRLEEAAIDLHEMVAPLRREVALWMRGENLGTFEVVDREIDRFTMLYALVYAEWVSREAENRPIALGGA